MSKTTRSKVFYYVLLTIGFGLIILPVLIGLVFNDYSLRNSSFGVVGITLFAIIVFTEVSFIKRKWFNIIGWVLLVALFIGFVFRVMHWPFGILFYIAGMALVLNLIIHAIVDKSKDVYQYFIFVFVFVRVLYYSPRPIGINFFDLVLSLVLFILGIFYSIKMLKKKT